MKCLCFWLNWSLDGTKRFELNSAKSEMIWFSFVGLWKYSELFCQCIRVQSQLIEIYEKVGNLYGLKPHDVNADIKNRTDVFYLCIK